MQLRAAALHRVHLDQQHPDLHAVHQATRFLIAAQ
jgi:hypothetical protein